MLSAGGGRKLTDDLGCLLKYRRRHRAPEALCRLEIDDEVKRARLLHRKVLRLRATQDLVYVRRDASKRSAGFGPYDIKPTSANWRHSNIDGPALARLVTLKLPCPEGTDQDHQRIGAPAPDGVHGGIEVAFPGDLDVLHGQAQRLRGLMNRGKLGRLVRVVRIPYETSREGGGMIEVSSSNLFGATLAESAERPVTLPPGRARLRRDLTLRDLACTPRRSESCSRLHHRLDGERAPRDDHVRPTRRKLRRELGQSIAVAAGDALPVEDHVLSGHISQVDQPTTQLVAGGPFPIRKQGTDAKQARRWGRRATSGSAPIPAKARLTLRKRLRSREGLPIRRL